MGRGRELGDLAQSALFYSGEGRSEPGPKAQHETVELQRQLHRSIRSAVPFYANGQYP